MAAQTDGSTQAPPDTPGRLFGVGVGPGDPELLTLKALRVLRSVPVICAPQSDRQEDSYALGIVKEVLDPRRQEIIRLPFSVSDPAAATAWRDAAGAIAERLYRAQDVAFITEGDPTLYSTFSYVLDSISREHPSIYVEIVPGVSSVTAAAGSGGVPLATRGQRLAILPAAYGVDDLSGTIAGYDTIVLMKVNRALAPVVAQLETMGRVGEAIHVSRATTPQERVARDLHELSRELSKEDQDYFSLLIIKRQPQ